MSGQFKPLYNPQKMQARDEPFVSKLKEHTEESQSEKSCESCENCTEHIKPRTIKNKGKSILLEVQKLLMMVLTMTKEEAIGVLDKFENNIIDFIEKIKAGEF